MSGVSDETESGLRNYLNDANFFKKSKNNKDEKYFLFYLCIENIEKWGLSTFFS